MEEQLYEQIVTSYAEALPNRRERQAFSDQIAHIQALTQNARELGTFLPAFASSIADLYAASAVAIWFEDTSGTVKRKVDVGWHNLAFDKATASAHRELVSFVMDSKTSIAVHPYSAPAPRAGVSNPTDSFLLLAPTKFATREVAVLEIALGPKPLRQAHNALVESYLDWLRWLGHNLQQGLERCFAEAEQPLARALTTLHETSLIVDDIQAQIREKIESSLRALAGQNFGSLASNQAVAKQVHLLLDSKGLRVKCPECGAAAILRCQNAGNSKTGAFMFDHYLDSGRTFHGGQAVFPTLEVVPKPPRRQAK